MDGIKLMWNAEPGKADRWITDMLTSVFTTTDIPENTVLGPCDLTHASLYDSIAFIALKCSDRRTTPYMLKVDMSSPSTESSCWLQLVRSARDAKEQNLEAYVKDGQLFFRALNSIRKDSELLAWYRRDLSQLLNLVSEDTEGLPPYSCPFCKQKFHFEYPLLAHQRFLCKERFLNLASSKVSQDSSHGKVDRPVTDFHNLARDLEKDRVSSGMDTEIGKKGKRKHEDSDGESGAEDLSLSASHRGPPIKKVCAERVTTQLRIPVPRRLTDVIRTDGAFTRSESSPGGNRGEIDLSGLQSLRQVASELKNKSKRAAAPCSGGDVSSLSELPAAKQKEEGAERSAFTQPLRAVPHGPPMVMPLPAGLPQLAFPISKLQSTAMFQAAMHKQGSLLLGAGAQTRPWTKPLSPSPVLRKASAAVAPSSSLFAYPLTSISTLGLPAQNWCAKCNLSFHMTSDLVHHMRSHHKRAPSAAEQGPRIKRDEHRLRCPICKESFRERHHLSRHMTSHT